MVQMSCQVSSIQQATMFQNSYQNGSYFDLLDPKAQSDKLKTLYRVSNPNINHKVFDKDLKTFVLEFMAPHARLSLPKEDKKELYLIQQFLVLQVHLFPGMAWNIELVVSDLTKTKRRIILSPSTTKTEIKPFFVKVPCHVQEGCWNNLAVDLYSFIEAFKGQTYRSLDAIYLTGHFKLRRIYTSACPPDAPAAQLLPKNFHLPAGPVVTSQLLRYEGETLSQAAYEPTEPSTKNSSFLKSKPKGHKTDKHIPESSDLSVKKMKDFLSNTNGEMVGYRKEEKSESESSQLIEAPRTAKSTDKTLKKKKLIKTQQMPPKSRSSVEKGIKHREQTGRKIQEGKRGSDRNQVKAKLNPWRSVLKEAGRTEKSQLESNEEERNTDTPQTVSLYKPEGYSRKFIETRGGNSQHCSDSDYVELSQKFSTLTDGKFLRKESNVEKGGQEKYEPEPAAEDEIEEHIEMESNSMCTSHHPREEEPPVPHEKIQEYMCDSLEKFQVKGEASGEVGAMGKSSLYGFGARLMRQYMGEAERPYSPPLGEREVTEEEVSARGGDEKEEVELIYDPVLNCYYDHKTHTYYELKN